MMLVVQYTNSINIDKINIFNTKLWFMNNFNMHDDKPIGK